VRVVLELIRAERLAGARAVAREAATHGPEQQQAHRGFVMFHEADDAQRVEVRGRDGQGRHSVATRRDETARFCRFAFPRRQEARLHVPRVVACERDVEHVRPREHRSCLYEVFEKCSKPGGRLRHSVAAGELVRMSVAPSAIFTMQEHRVDERRRLPEQDDHVAPETGRLQQGYLLVALERIAHSQVFVSIG